MTDLIGFKRLTYFINSLFALTVRNAYKTPFPHINAVRWQWNVAWQLYHERDVEWFFSLQIATSNELGWLQHSKYFATDEKIQCFWMSYILPIKIESHKFFLTRRIICDQTRILQWQLLIIYSTLNNLPVSFHFLRNVCTVWNIFFLTKILLNFSSKGNNSQNSPTVFRGCDFLYGSNCI